jgi:hypothetical protein
MAVVVCVQEETRASISSPSDLATQIFRESPYPSIRLLNCCFREGTLTIAGRVSSFYLKQLAQIAVQHLDGVERISNLTEVDT